MSTIGLIISNRRKELGLTLEEVGNAVGVSKSTVKKWETGYISNMRRDRINALAKILKLNPNVLIDESDPPYSQIDQKKKSMLDSVVFQLWDNCHSEELIPKKSIPMLGKIACGEPIYADEDFDTFIEVNSDLKADFCLTCSGDSMINANIFDGDIVFIKKQDIVDDGQIAAVIIEDEATLKRVYYDRKNNRLILQAENPKYSPLIYIGEELNNIRILGRAISLYRKIK